MEIQSKLDPDVFKRISTSSARYRTPDNIRKQYLWSKYIINY